MNIHHLRNATLVIETKDKVILVDPMLGDKGTSAPSFTLFRFKAQRNPIVGLSDHAMSIVEKTTHCLITHLHPDHLDKAAEQFLKQKNIPVICSVKDEKKFKKRGLNVEQAINYWEPSSFLRIHQVSVEFCLSFFNLIRRHDIFDDQRTVTIQR